MVLHPIDRLRAIERFEAIPKLVLGHFPTPIEKLPRFREALLAQGIKAVPRMWIKRDDYSGPGFGGNKVRKLEYVFARAQAEGVDAVITCGGVRSNHCRVTAMLAARLGMQCVLVMNQPAHPYPAKPASLAIEEWVGARVIPVYRREDRAPEMEHAAEELRQQGHNPMVIPLGASGPLGAMGFVNAAAELAAQMDAKEIPFDVVVVCTSSGGTQSGLEAGRHLFWKPDVRLIGVSPDDSEGSIQSTVLGILEGVASMLGLDAFDVVPEVWDGYIGDGYGIESPAGREALSLLARTEGIVLDPVYTAKAMAGLIDAVRQGRIDAGARVLFWHTGGQMALFYQ